MEKIGKVGEELRKVGYTRGGTGTAQHRSDFVTSCERRSTCQVVSAEPCIVYFSKDRLAGGGGR